MHHHSVLLVALLTTTAHADEFHLDVEIDPTAYVLAGHSVHAGIGWRNVRVDVGTYGMELPAWLHGNEGWSVRFIGGGAKLQWFPWSDAPRGWYVDASVGVSRQTFENAGRDLTETVIGVGAAAGYRFELPYRFYATPWVGLNYDLGTGDVVIAGETFERSVIFPFAAVHVGFELR
ncbi:MAG TPA: hypothetical protein VK427_19680 [Kofleriaceae bacterium]|nr:hypothetical protein [Kofleriaceae bacterium]